MDKEFLQPCGCIVRKRWRGNRPPLWYIEGQDEGISENPIHVPFLYSDKADGNIIRKVLREFCPHQRFAQQANAAESLPPQKSE